MNDNFKRLCACISIVGTRRGGRQGGVGDGD